MIYDFDKSTFIYSTNFFTCMARIWNSVWARFFTDIRILNIFWAKMRMYINTYKETNKVYNPTPLMLYDFDKSTFICSIAKVKKVFLNAFVGLKKASATWPNVWPYVEDCFLFGKCIKTVIWSW